VTRGRRARAAAKGGHIIVGALGRGHRIIIGLAAVATAVSAVLALGGANSILVFAVTAATLALLATVVGTGTEQVGERLGPGATGVLQASLGNLPELFISIFALRAGLAAVVQAALVGSILANSLLVLGLAFFLGGLRHGTQQFASAPARMIAILTVLTVAVLAVPSLARVLHTPAAAHADELSAFSAVVLLLVFAFSLRHSLVGETGRAGTPTAGHAGAPRPHGPRAPTGPGAPPPPPAPRPPAPPSPGRWPSPSRCSPAPRSPPRSSRTGSSRR